jgi:hypothetical protein
MVSRDRESLAQVEPVRVKPLDAGIKIDHRATGCLGALAQVADQRAADAGRSSVAGGDQIVDVELSAGMGRGQDPPPGDSETGRARLVTLEDGAESKALRSPFAVDRRERFGGEFGPQLDEYREHGADARIVGRQVADEHRH